jgi:hypothetical protein
MNAHSVAAALSSEPFSKVVDQCLIEWITYRSIDDRHHGRAIERRAHRIDVEMQMRRSDAELEQDGAIGAGRREQGAFDAMMHGREMRSIIDRQIGDILNMRFPHDHGVPARSPVVVQGYERAIVLA